MLNKLTVLTFCVGFVASREPEVEIADLFGDVLFQQGIGEGVGIYIIMEIVKKKCQLLDYEGALLWVSHFF